MRIAQVANLYARVSGGLRVAVEALGDRYLDAGHERVLIVPGPRERVVAGERELRLALRGVAVPASGGYRILPSRALVERRLHRLAPDVLEVSDKLTLSGLGAWGRRVGIPAVLISHERLDAILSERTPSTTALRSGSDRWNRRLVGSFDAVVCASDFAAQEFRRIGATNVHRVPLGVDLATFRPSPPSRGRDDGSSAITIVCVGRLSREKRPDLAIEALRVLRARGIDARLRLAGEGPQRRRLVRLAAALPVEFLGHVRDRDTLRTIVAGADVALAPCPYETFGLAALEALACGTPVVVPPYGALPELVHDGCGAVATSLAPRAFADAVQGVLARPPGALRAAARTHAEAFSWTASAARMLDLYGALLEERGAARETA